MGEGLPLALQRTKVPQQLLHPTPIQVVTDRSTASLQSERQQRKRHTGCHRTGSWWCWTSLSPAVKQLLGLQRQGPVPPTQVSFSGAGQALERNSLEPTEAAAVGEVHQLLPGVGVGPVPEKPLLCPSNGLVQPRWHRDSEWCPCPGESRSPAARWGLPAAQLPGQGGCTEHISASLVVEGWGTWGRPQRSPRVPHTLPGVQAAAGLNGPALSPVRCLTRGVLGEGRCEGQHAANSRQDQGQCQAQPLAPKYRMGPEGAARKNPPLRLPLTSSQLPPTAAKGTRPAEPWSCHFRHPFS